MRQPRHSDIWLDIDISPRPRRLLSTTRSIDDEVFASLEYISEIEDVGINYIKRFGHSKPKKAFLLFQSFVRQAKTFYESASHLNYRASALIYYYSFLNLAKAYICLADPVFVSSPLTHGLRHSFQPGKFSTQYVTTERKGVFKKFYELMIDREIPPKTNLNIARILGYCTDIEHEYTSAGYGNPRIIPAGIRLLSNQKLRISWPILVIGSFEIILPYKKTLNAFNEYFELIEPPKDIIRQVFGLLVQEQRGYSFFESKTAYPWISGDLVPLPQIVEACFSALHNLYETNVYNDQLTIFLNAPLRKNLQIPFSQVLSIYTVMFYLGSLVRYRPDYLEKLLNSKDGWIIERFTYSAPSTFLRSIANLILGQDYVYKTR